MPLATRIRAQRRERLRLGGALDPFVLALLATVAVATLLPARGAIAAGLSQAIAFAIGWLFFLYGVRLPVREALRAARSVRLQVSALLTTYVLFPLVGLGTFVAASMLLSPDLARGLLYLALVPSTVQSSVALTAIAGGNVAAALCAASLSNLLGVVLTPLWVGVLLGGTVGFSGRSVVAIVSQLVVPFLVGVLLRPWLVGWAERFRTILQLTDRAVILLVVYVAFARGVADGIWRQLALIDLLLLLAICGVLLGFMLLMTSVVGRWLRLEPGDRIVLCLCGSQKSLASGVPMATLLLPATSLGLFVLPLMVYHQLELLAGSLIAQRLSRRPLGAATSRPSGRRTRTC